MDQVYQQDLSQESPRPGGPFLIQMLFREPTELPDRDTMLRVLQQHCGRLDCFCHDEKMAGFAALDHMATFQDGSAPVQLMVTACSGINLGSVVIMVRPAADWGSSSVARSRL